MLDLGKALAFLKQAYDIDGHATLLPQEEAEHIVSTYHRKVFKLTDSKRGTFYVATFQPAYNQVDHLHCWEQKQPPACGDTEPHKSCHLCNTPNPSAV